MKFILALLFIGAVAAQPTQAPNHNEGRALVESLEKRADALLHVVHTTLRESRNSHGHLLQTLERQAILVEALAIDLKHQLADPQRVHHIHHIHTIEEDLLFLENRVSEEIAIIHHFQNGGHNPSNETPAQIVARAERLVKEAKDAVAKFPKAREVKEIDSEVIVVGALIKAIQAKPSPADLKKEEEELARHERTLHQLIEKATDRRH